MAAARIRPVILSGGAGTRLWPVSRAAHPKQMQALAGPKTMLQTTAARVADPERFLPPFVVASAAHADQVEAQLAEIGDPADALILEPCGRNTAAAIALAALAAAPDELLLAMPSDHVILDPAAFLAAIGTAALLAAEGWLVTFGIRPEHAETGYGYIRRGEALEGGAFAVAEFVEKPDLATAKAYLADGGYDWNGGIFLFRAGRFLDELAAHAPDILASVRGSMEAARRSGARIEPDAGRFAATRAQSIDVAVMEAADRIAVVPVEMGWSDVGSWDALYEISARDAAGNAVSGDVSAPDSRNCLLRSDGPLVVAAGVEDLIVIATGDAVLVMRRGDSQAVKEAVAALKRDGHPVAD